MRACPLQEKTERRAQVLLFAFQLCNRPGLLSPTQLGFGLLGKRQVIPGMRGAARLQFPTALQALQPVLPDRLQDEKAWLAISLLFLMQQVVLQQHAHPIQDIARSRASFLRDGLDGLQGAATDEDGKASEELLLLER